MHVDGAPPRDLYATVLCLRATLQLTRGSASAQSACAPAQAQRRTRRRRRRLLGVFGSATGLCFAAQRPVRRPIERGLRARPTGRARAPPGRTRGDRRRARGDRRRTRGDCTRWRQLACSAQRANRQTSTTPRRAATRCASAAGQFARNRPSCRQLSSRTAARAARRSWASSSPPRARSPSARSPEAPAGAAARAAGGRGTGFYGARARRRWQAAGPETKPRPSRCVRGGIAAPPRGTTWIFRGRVAATPRLPRGYSEEARRSERPRHDVRRTAAIRGALCARGRGPGRPERSRFGRERPERSIPARDRPERSMPAQAAGRRRIAQVASSLRLGAHYVDGAHRLFSMAAQRNFTQGRKTLHVVCACLYVMCRREKSPHLLIDFSDVLQTNVYALGATFLKFRRLLNLELPLIDPSLRVRRAGRPLTNRGAAAAVDADLPWRDESRGRGHTAETTTWIVRGGASRRRRGRGCSSETRRGDATAATRTFRGCLFRGGASRDATTWIVRGGASRRRRGRDAASPRRDESRRG